MKRTDNDVMRERILEAVIDCKVEAAGAAVSLSQISSRAGISERTLNRYFPDKEMLLYDAAICHLRRMHTDFASRYQAAVQADMTGLQRLLLLLQILVDRNSEDMNRAKVFVRAYTTALRTAVYRDLPVTGYDASVRDIVVQCVRDGVKDGSIREDADPLDIYMLVSSNYMGLVQRLIYFYSVSLSKEDHQRELLQVFGRYIRMLEGYLDAGQKNA